MGHDILFSLTSHSDEVTSEDYTYKQENIKWYMAASNDSMIFVRQLNSQVNRRDSSMFCFFHFPMSAGDMLGGGAKVNVGQYKVMESKRIDQIVFKREIERFKRK